MINLRYGNLVNFAWFQLLWFTAVLGGNVYIWALLLLIGVHFLLVSQWRREFILLSLVMITGASFDSVLAIAGLFVFESTGPLPIPLWHVALWIGFAGTLRHSMRFVVDRPTVLLIAVAIFAPLSYLAAERLGAVVFPMGGLFTSAVVGIVWVLLAPVLIALVNYLEKETPGVAAQGESLHESQEMKHG